MSSSFASVIVLTRNRARWLDGALAALTKLEYGGYEIVVVDHSSDDDTAEIAASHGARRVVCPPSYGIGRCRGVGLEEARGDLIAWCDDDCRPEPDWLKALAGRLAAEPDIGLVGGQVINVGFPGMQQFKGRTKTIGPNGRLAFAADPQQAEFFGHANLAYRREAVRRAGGYDPFFHAGAEIDLALSMRRAGYRVVYEPSAVIHHHFTGIDHKRGRIFWGGQLMRLYRYLKHTPPRGVRAWSRFWWHELGLFAGDLRRLARGTVSALLRRQPNRLGAQAVALFNALSSRAAVPWLAWRASGWWRDRGAP